MALQLQDMLMRLQPLSPLNPSGGSDKSLQRQQLELARQQFEETKRQHLEETRLHEMAEAGAMARERMQTERALQAQQAAAQAKVMEERRAAYGDIYKYEDAGDVEGMENAANRLNDAGGSAERLGEDENGMPSWRVETDPERARAEQRAQGEQAAPQALPPGATDESLPQSLNRMNALGYDTLNTRGNLNETAPGAGGIGSSDEMTPEQIARVTGGGTADRAATERAVAQPPMEVAPDMGPPTADADTDLNPIKPEYRATQALDPLGGLRPRSLPPVQPDAPDFMGGVPRNVIDTGAMAEQTKQRLGPVMANIEASMPPAYRDATKHADDAALGAGLSGPDAMKQSLALRAPADAAIKDEQAAERDAEKARLAAAPKELTRKDIQRLAEGGEKEAEKTFKNSNLDEVPRRAGAAQNMIDILQDDDPNNDQAIAFELPNMLGSKGAQSNKDLAVALGIDAMSTTDQITETFNRIVHGGFTEMRRDSLIGIIKKKMEADDELVFKYLDAIDESSKRAVDPDVKRGLEDYANRNVPKEYRDAWAKMHGGDKDAPDTEPDADTDDEGEPGDVTIPEASRIARVHNNPGNLMFADQPGAEKGEAKEGGGHWAKFASVDAGLEALHQQVETDAKRGLSIRAFVMKYAPPTDGNDTEKYISEAVHTLSAKSADDPLSGVDPNAVVRFVAHKESSTEVPGGEKAKPAAPKNTASVGKGKDDAKLLEGL